MKRFCVYCGKNKEEVECTVEHVVPQAIGGNLPSVNPFLLRDVCERCNNLCGLFVDGPFLKSWITQNDKAFHASIGANLGPKTILPLTYLAKSDELRHGDRICDLWLGPTGDTIYHFHELYPEEPESGVFVGPPPSQFRSELDGGFAFLFVRATNPVWLPAILNSFVNEFWRRAKRRSILYWGNGPTPKGGVFSDIPSELQELREQLKSMAGKPHGGTLGHNIHQGERFLGKLALGFGALFLKESFKTSRSADRLREYIWQPNYEKRVQMGVMGTRFGVPLDPKLLSMLEWPSGHFLGLFELQGSLYLYARIFKMQAAIMQISDEHEHWEGLIDRVDWTVFVISPGVGESIGPQKLSTFLSFRTGSNSHGASAFEDLAMRSKPKALPPFDI